jgi:hypothetical protein
MTPLLQNSITPLLSQLPIPAPGQLETWLIPAVAILSIAALVKKVFPRKRDEDAFVTRAELHHELNTVRDKIDSRFLTLSEKIETVGLSIHTRLNQLDAGLARVDERTKLSIPSH